MTGDDQRRASGSVLIYVFIGIILFASLTLAISRSGRQTMSHAGAEQAQLAATQILDYANMLRRGVQIMKVNGIGDSQICFDQEGWGHNDYDYAACAASRNRVFEAGGGGVSYQNPAPDLLDTSYAAEPLYGKWHITGANSVTGVGTDCDPNADCNEILAVLPYLRRPICAEINKKLQNTNDGTIPVDDAGFLINQSFKGVFSDGEAINTMPLNAKRSGCFEADTTPASGYYIFYVVLSAR